jgi:hypothetical protein
MAKPAPKEEQSGGFDYCFWSKLLVAIVLFPVAGFIAASFFDNAVYKLAAAIACITVLILLAQRLDQLPSLACKIPPLLGKGKKP